jgi:hypothetical protein
VSDQYFACIGWGLKIQGELPGRVLDKAINLGFNDGVKYVIFTGNGFKGGEQDVTCIGLNIRVHDAGCGVEERMKMDEGLPKGNRMAPICGQAPSLLSADEIMLAACARLKLAFIDSKLPYPPELENPYCYDFGWFFGVDSY